MKTTEMHLSPSYQRQALLPATMTRLRDNTGVTQIGFRVEIFSPCLTRRLWRFYENNTAEKLFTLEKTTLFQNSQMFYNTPAGCVVAKGVVEVKAGALKLSGMDECYDVSD
ncbi:hypothetical protein OUZ56_005437 [Daphnia magna]|uniref:GMP synthase n=1 Tax=Daphnia magna TaxID=35525 RepID=A0ABQ9YST2_9CRUS|nr:hypothetical protein OUZ56_005437 [Daphnia magna]